MRLLSYAIEAGRPLPAALSTLARHHFDHRTRQRLLLARNEVEQGAEVWDALVTAGLVSRQDALAVRQASSTSSQLWILRRLADWHRVQVDHQLETRLALLHPAAVLLFAVGVLITAAGVFQFLTALIHGLA